MKINDIVTESTTAGAIATVAAPMTTQSRNASIYGGKKGGNLLTGKKTSKKYANSVHESKMKQVAMDLENMQDGNFKQKYGKTKEKMKMLLGDPKGNKTVQEAHLEEDDLILVPGQGHRLKTGFHKFDPDKAEHEGETLKNSLRTIARNAKELHQRLENHDQFPEWVSEKIGTIKGMMTAVTEYLISQQEEEPEVEGVIAGGGVGEAADPIAKRITAKKWGGDDMYSWAVLVDGRPAVTGLSKSQVSYYKNMIMKKLREKPHLTGANIEEAAKKGLWANIHAKRERIKHGSGERMRKPGSKGAPSAQDFKDSTNEAQSMGDALKNTLAKAEPGSKLDKSIKAHNAKIKAGEAGTLKNAPTGYHFDKQGYCRLGDK